MAKTPNRDPIPNTNSIKELAEFWDTHDFTDYEDEFEEVKEKVFVRKPSLKVSLDEDEMNALASIAKDKGLEATALVRLWIQEHIRS
jgi:hypothetical protein